MSAYIMDHFIDRERVKALMVMSRAYVPPPNFKQCFLLIRLPLI